MFTEKDDKLIDLHFKELLKVCEGTCKQDGDLERITEAFRFANKAHYGVRRKSGEPYILHPIAVAMIVVSEVGLGVKSVISSLLHDVVEDTSYTVGDIARLFGEKISQMVDGLTKMKLRGSVETGNSEQAENFKKMLLTLSDDVRVIIIKLADRLHNMRTLGSMPSHKQMKIVSETIYLFAPLAHRLGLYEIKSELEDLSLKYSFPEEYKLISNKISETENARNEYIDNFNAPIIESLRQNNIEFEVTGRVKSIYSIWRKMQRKSVTIDEVYDLFAIRIVFKSTSFVPEKSQCWHIYSLVTDIYKPKPDRIRDWVNIPKANGYEALHCTVMGQNGNWVEIQIRSTRMNDIAERGFAAHWKYKAEGKDNNDNSNVLDKWIKDVRSALNSPTKDASEFLDDFKLNLYNTEVVVFTPNGETKTLPKGAIILDFAYEVHSKLGHTAIGAKVNHKIVPLYTEIQSGDQIEIITSSKSKPKLDWLSYVITAKSKQAIKTFLKKDKESTIDMGIEMFDAKLRALHVDPKGNVFKEVLSYYGCATKDEFYSNLSLGLINLEDLDDVVSKVKKPQKQNKLIRYWSLQLGNTLKFLGGKPKQEGKSNEIVVAKCCNPMPGDEVVGFKDDNCVIVHKKSCDEAIKRAARDGKSIVPIEWNSEKVMSKLMFLELRGIDRMGILLDISVVLTSQYSVNIRSLSIDSHDGVFEGNLTIYISSKEHLDQIIERLRLVKGIDFVRCVENFKSAETNKSIV